jgi:MinD-like ATPase involved in chromosome partitioning or flagellar assembly
MAIVAVTGDACTTTTVALAAAWPRSDDAVVLEADPTGGDLAAWFDMPVNPSLSTVVTRLGDGGWAGLDRFTRLAPPGLRLIPAPANAAEAQQAVAESARSLVGAIAAAGSPIVFVDTGRLVQPPAAHPFVAAATVTVLVHRQSPQSARAAAVRLQRLADQIDASQAAGVGLVVAVVGAAPFDLRQIDEFLADVVGSVPVIGLPVDTLAAGAYAGRAGVSERRLARLPLARAARDLGAAVELAVRDRVIAPWDGGRP